MARRKPNGQAEPGRSNNLRSKGDGADGGDGASPAPGRGRRRGRRSGPAVNEITGGQVMGTSELDDGKKRGYSTDNFYLASVDRNKQAQTARTDTIRMPMYEVALIAQWIADPRLPYKTQADFFRDAAHHRNVFLAQAVKDPGFDFGAWEHHARIMELEHLASEWETQVKDTRQVLENMTKRGDYDAFDLIVKEADEMKDKMPQPYRGQIEQMIEDHRRIVHMDRGRGRLS